MRPKAFAGCSADCSQDHRLLARLLDLRILIAGPRSNHVKVTLLVERLWCRVLDCPGLRSLVLYYVYARAASPEASGRWFEADLQNVGNV